MKKERIKEKVLEELNKRAEKRLGKHKDYADWQFKTFVSDDLPVRISTQRVANPQENIDDIKRITGCESNDGVEIVESVEQLKSQLKDQRKKIAELTLVRKKEDFEMKKDYEDVKKMLEDNKDFVDFLKKENKKFIPRKKIEDRIPKIIDDWASRCHAVGRGYLQPDEIDNLKEMIKNGIGLCVQGIGTDKKK